MIEINLVPEQLRKKRKATAGAPSTDTSFSQAKLMSTVGNTIKILLCVHIPFQIFIVFKTIQYHKYEQERGVLSPERKSTEDAVKQLKDMQEKSKSMQGIAAKRDIFWSKKMNEISDNLPRGLWLARVALDKDVLIIQGSALLKDETKMSIHSLTANLKSSAIFMDSFHDIEPGLIKRREIGPSSVQDFTITANLK